MYRVLFLVVIFAAACGPKPTPFPVDLPTEMPATATSPPAQPIHYALHSNTLGAVAEIDQLAENAVVDQIEGPVPENEPGDLIDIVAAYGDWAGWQRSALTPYIAMVINPAIMPLSEPRVLEMLRASLDPERLVSEMAIPGAGAVYASASEVSALRAEQANLGFPDGFRLNAANGFVPGIGPIQAQLRAAGFESAMLMLTEAKIREGFANGWLHLAFIVWTTSETRAAWVEDVGEANVIDLYLVPISYKALPGLDITFTPGGWPVARRAS